ncbi:MAG: hypothetical protein FWC97_12670 [Treponema sp.]|nr:hypothetical protein [Treponema sp.]
MPKDLKFVTIKETNTRIDEEGNETVSKVEKRTTISRNDEPDYIKIYTNMWSEFHGVPIAYRGLFLQLAIRMTYCNADDLENAQLVNTGKPWCDDIMKTLNWGNDMYKRGLRELVKSRAIRRVARGVYQINPRYAGKGEWKYNTRLGRGGIEDLIATFKFKDKKVETTIIWADDGSDDKIDENFRQGLGVKASEEAVLSFSQTKPIKK